jgi:serine/threonine protein kinase
MRKKYSGPSVDIWAMGVLLFVMLTGFIPFDTPQKVVDVKYAWPENIPVASNAKELISRCFQVRCFCKVCSIALSHLQLKQFNPEERITMYEIRSHSFVRLPFEEISVEELYIDEQIVQVLMEEMGIRFGFGVFCFRVLFVNGFTEVENFAWRHFRGTHATRSMPTTRSC